MKADDYLKMRERAVEAYCNRRKPKAMQRIISFVIAAIVVMVLMYIFNGTLEL